jgi:hypothetical protein
VSNFDKYVERATDALRDSGFVDPDDDTVPTYRGNNPIPVWVPAEGAAKAVLAAVGPLIAEDTRERMVAAAARAVEREGSEDPRAKIVADLRWLAAARKEYCQRCPDDEGEMRVMTPTELAVHSDHEAAEQLAGIIEGVNSARGWLPSWLWDEWEARR